jgi:negative regulator of sigma-B (phosphoserine phosphatase)
MGAVNRGSARVECATAARTLTGQTESGDLSLIEPIEAGLLVAAVDGLGHGPEAAAAARIAAETLRAHSGEGVGDLLGRCHQRLKGTRGAVMSLASFDSSAETMTWAGVGNVEGMLLRAPPSSGPARESLLLLGGLIGERLPSHRAATLPLRPGDVLVFATDGIRHGFHISVRLDAPAQEIANDTLERFATGHDDALVVVVRWLGGVA